MKISREKALKLVRDMIEPTDEEIVQFYTEMGLVEPKKEPKIDLLNRLKEMYKIYSKDENIGPIHLHQIYEQAMVIIKELTACDNCACMYESHLSCDGCNDYSHWKMKETK